MIRSYTAIAAMALLTASAQSAAPAAGATLIGGVYPFAVGDTFTDEVSETQTETGSPTTKFAYVQTTTIGAAVAYAGVKAYPVRSTGKYSTPAGITSVDDVEYRNFVTSGGKTYYALYGYDDGSTLVPRGGTAEKSYEDRIEGTPYYFDILPEKPSAWPEPVAYKQSLLEYDGTTEDTTRAADGAYEAKGIDHYETFLIPYVRILYANGTGTNSETLSGGVREYTFGLPVSKGGKIVIPVTKTYEGGKATADVPDWYPSHAAPSKPLATTTMTDFGVVKAPAACGARAGTSATKLEDRFEELDPVYGFTYLETDTYYVKAGLGRICRVISTVETLYDNETTGAIDSVDTTTTSEVLLSEKIH
jgi:hypothetical protein